MPIKVRADTGEVSEIVVALAIIAGTVAVIAAVATGKIRFPYDPDSR